MNFVLLWLLVMLRTDNKCQMFMIFTRYRWSLWAFVFLSITFSHHRGNRVVIAMPLDNPEDLIAALNLAKIHPPSIAENQLLSDLKRDQHNVEVPDFMLENYKDMNKHYCDRRVIRSFPGKVTDEKAKLSCMISFTVAPLQEDDESPYNVEIRLSFQSSRADAGKRLSENITELFQIIIWAEKNFSQSEQHTIRQNVTWSTDNTVSRQSSRIYDILENSYPVFDDNLTVPITKKGRSRDGERSEAVIDLHSTEVMDKLYGMRETWQLILEIRPVNPRSLQDTFQSKSGNSGLQPSSYFVVYSLRKHTNCFPSIMNGRSLFEADSARSKRSASFPPTSRLRSLPGGERERPRHKRLCHKRSLYVDFQTVGWDQWIVAPSGYWAHYCEGACRFPMSDRLNSTNHAILQSLLHSMIPRIPSSCCTPSKLNPISILYRNQNEQLVLKQYGGMVVESCGCQ